MVCDPAVVPLNVTVHVAVAPVPDSVHGEPVNVPAGDTVNVTVPVGVIAVPGEMSVTVAVHVEVDPTIMLAGVHDIVVVVARSPTVTVALPLLVA